MQQAHWMSLSEEDRFRRCGELFALAKQFARERAPSDLTESEMGRFIFRELYGFDLPDYTNGNSKQ